MRFILTRTSEHYGDSRMMITVEPKTVEELLTIVKDSNHPIIIFPPKLFKTAAGYRESIPEIEIYDDYRE